MDSITDNIWIGNYLDAKDKSALAWAGIRSILCLDGCLAGTAAEKAGVDRVEIVELIDGAGNSPETFLRAVRLLREMVLRHAPVLVHCHAGQSRSAAVVCKYFMQQGDSLAEAMRRITSKRRIAIIAGLQEALDFDEIIIEQGAAANRRSALRLTVMEHFNIYFASQVLDPAVAELGRVCRACKTTRR